MDSNHDFSHFTIAVIGLGLMGGSFAKRFKAIGSRVIGINRTASVAQEALRMGIVDSISEEDLKDADIVIFCTPVKVSLSFTMCFLQAIRRLRQAPLVSQPFPFLWAEPCHTGVSLSCVAGHGRTTFPTVAPRSLPESLFPDWKSHGVQPLMAHCKHKRI